MIVVNKPFRYLRENFKWNYEKGWHGKRIFTDPDSLMAFERRELMLCKMFEDRITKKKTKDAEYKIMDLLTFLSKSTLTCYNEIKFDQYYWNFDLVKFALKIIRNAEIGVPTKESFPLIIRNDYYNLYIAPKIEEEVN